MIAEAAIERRARALSFLAMCRKAEARFSLTPKAEPTGYALCFAVFVMKLLGALPEEREPLAVALEAEMRAFRARTVESALRDKPYRQYLAFTLSAFAALGALQPETLADLVREQVEEDIPAALARCGCLEGRAGSGNQALFVAVFLLHARDVLGLPVQARIDQWVDLHLRAMNRFGFWGSTRGMTHLQFQNGYHQYEILEYLGVSSPFERESVEAVRSLADGQGHFAPYPGGGGCYDYDAVFLLTPEGRVPDEPTRMLLHRTAATLAAEQRENGGFAESLGVRPRSLARGLGFARAVIDAARRGNAPLLGERLRYALTLQRPAHDRIATHWSRYSRAWDEADLWDTWFRLLALARLEVAEDLARAEAWGFIDYPGIGYHPSLKKKAGGR